MKRLMCWFGRHDWDVTSMVGKRGFEGITGVYCRRCGCLLCDRPRFRPQIETIGRVTR